MSDSSLIIGVAASAAERVRLARLFGGREAVLLVSTPEQAAGFLQLAGSARMAAVAASGEAAAASGETVADAAEQEEDAVRPPGDAKSDASGNNPPPGTLFRTRFEDGAPATPVELLAAALSPARAEQPPFLRLDDERRVVLWRDQEAGLTRLEHEFLRCLLTEPGRVWTYQRLHQAVWGNEHLAHGSHLHSVVKRLRRKLARLGADVTIHAVRGVGFRLPRPADRLRPASDRLSRVADRD